MRSDGTISEKTSAEYERAEVRSSIALLIKAREHMWSCGSGRAEVSFGSRSFFGLAFQCSSVVHCQSSSQGRCQDSYMNL